MSKISSRNHDTFLSVTKNRPLLGIRQKKLVAASNGEREAHLRSLTADSGCCRWRPGVAVAAAGRNHVGGGGRANTGSARG
jgi:hypothetical protein